MKTVAAVVFGFLAPVFFLLGCGAPPVGQRLGAGPNPEELALPRLSSAVVLFEGHDLSAGDYTLLALSHLKNNDNSPMKPEYFINDPQILRRIQRKWVFDRGGSGAWCGYDYTIVLVKGREQAQEHSVRLDPSCSEIVGEHSGMYFPAEFFDVFVEHGNELQWHRKQFATLTQARAFRDEERQRRDFVYESPTHWPFLSGSFLVSYSETIADEQMFAEMGNPQKKSPVAAQLEESFDSSEYEILGKQKNCQQIEGGMNQCKTTHTVLCNQDLAERFDLFTVEGEWEERVDVVWEWWTR